jgi:hypothetical protein
MLPVVGYKAAQHLRSAWGTYQLLIADMNDTLGALRMVSGSENVLEGQL